MSISRLSAPGSVTRERGSNGHDAVDQASQPAAQPKRNARVEEVAKMYERQFLGEMFKAMRSTVTPTDTPSMAENIYRDQLDDTYVDAWADKGGIGLSNMIYDQIMERVFGQSTTANIRKQGPVALTDRDVISVARLKTTDATSSQVPLRVEVKPADGEGRAPAKIQAPWDAKVLQSNKIDGGKTAVTLEHGEGLRSTLIFDGVPSAETKVGEKMAKGQTIGVLNPESKSFLWNLNQKTPVEAGSEPAN